MKLVTAGGSRGGVRGGRLGGLWQPCRQRGGAGVKRAGEPVDELVVQLRPRLMKLQDPTETIGSRCPG
jgi:hypothetical protein